jgi:hypothetical protein
MTIMEYVSAFVRNLHNIDGAAALDNEIEWSLLTLGGGRYDKHWPVVI